MITFEWLGTNGRTARTAGLLYLIVVATGIFSLAYVPSQITVSGDPSATVGNLLAHASLFRLGIVAGAICYVAFLLLPLVLYRLLGAVSRGVAALMVVFAAIQTPIFFINLVHKLDVLSLLDGAGDPQAFTTAQLHAQVMQSLASYGNGMRVSEVFMGLWLLPFGYLVFKSGVLPRLLGIALMAGCFGYLIDFAGNVLFPGYPQTTIASYVTLPASFGEIGTCLWLLIVGVRQPKAAAVVPARHAA